MVSDLTARVAPNANGAAPYDDMGRFLDRMLELTIIPRRASVPGRKARESVAEHSFQLAMVVMYLVEAYPAAFEGMDRYLLLRYTLTHDGPESYIGDPPWDMLTKLKKRLERGAVRSFRSDFPKAPGIAGLFTGYMNKRDRESRCAAWLDKIVASCIIFKSGGISWQEENQTQGFVIATLKAKFESIGEVPTLLHQLADELLGQLAAHPELFAPDSPVPAALLALLPAA